MNVRERVAACWRRAAHLKETPVGKRLSKIGEAIREQPVLSVIVLAFCLDLVLEMLGRHSVWKAFVYLGTHPFMFLMNWLIILLPLCVALFVPKKSFAMMTVAVLWLALGTVNYIVLGFRTTPLSAIDFEVIRSAMDVIPAYMSAWEIGLLAFSIVAVIILLVICWRKTGRKKSTYKQASVVTVCTLAGVACLMGLTLNTEVFATDFRNLPRAYRTYGFAYCFTASVMENGINKPMTYSQQSVEALEQRLNQLGDGDTTQTPNVIVVQLESFFDVNLLKNVRFNQNPIPNYTALRDQFSSGKVRVPALGGGTANVEFELLTGMCLEFFSAGEYPYNSILQESTCESMAYNLKERGYGTHAIHNHKGTFYDRNIVYSNLGFDDFISAENMEPLEYTPRNWEKDGILTSQIIKALDATEEQDFVFTISVQTHGKYPTDRRSYVRHVRVEQDWDETKAQKRSRHQFEYYVNQVYETDQFVGELVKALEERGEPTVLLLYGDHLPALDLTEEDLTDGGLYQTDWIMWDNIGLEKQDGFFHSYELGAELMRRIGFSNGVLTKYHQLCSEDSRYYDNLGVLEYDMLYGKRYIYHEGEIPYEPTPLRFGLADVTISDVQNSWDGTVTVYGDHFTTHSKIYINEEKQGDTVYVDEHTLTLPGTWLQPGDVLMVGQAATELQNLGTSQDYVYRPSWTQ